MPKKPESKLFTVQKQGDALKKKVDKFIKEAQGKFPKFEKGKLSKKDITNLRSRCLKEKVLVEELLGKADNLEKRDEQEKVAEFDQRKQDEINRLDNLKEELERIAHKLMPPDEELAKKEEAEKAKAAEKEQEETDDEDEYETDDDEEVTDEEEEEEDEAVVGKNKKPEKDVREKQEEVGDSEEEEEEDDEEEEDEEETDESEEDETNYKVQAVGDYEGQEKGDLDFKVGEILTILCAREDGWLHAMNEQGDEGLVPSTYLREYNDEEDDEEETGDDEDEEEDEEDEEDEQESLSSKKQTPRSAKTLWTSVRETVKETCVTDVLQAMGAVPAGFRVSTLARLQQQEQHSLKGYLTPKLSASNVGYRDLFINHSTDRIRSIPVTSQRIVTLVSVRQMPLPGAGIGVTSRHVRICLFDGTNVLSNVHTIKVASVEKDEKTWNFNRKITDVMKSLEYGECFIRTNTSHTNLGILFELCVSYVRTTTGQTGEFSCGWLHLPLFDQDPKPVPNKTYDMTLNGGTPFERGVLVDPILGRRTEGSLLKSLMASNKQPCLTIRMAAPTKIQKELLDTLPEVLVSSTSYILYMSMYRETLTDALLRDRTDLQSVEPIHSPVLALFPDVAQIPDLMDVLRMGWAETQKVTKRADKKDPEALKELFRRVFMDYVFPLLSCASLSEFDMTQPNILQERQTEISRVVDINKTGHGPGVSLVSANILHKPFNISELTFSPIGPHSEGSLLKSLMASNKQPRLTIRMAAPTKIQKELLDTLPEVLVSSTSYILYMSMYRETLTDALLRDRTDLQSVEPIHSPVLALFPDVAQISDLMDVLRMGWAETQKVTKRADKKDPEALKELFRRVFMDYVFPLLSCASLSEFDMTQPNILQERQTEISRVVDINKTGHGPGVSLVSANILHKPFNISELTFSPIGPHCVARVY